MALGPQTGSTASRRRLTPRRRRCQQIATMGNRGQSTGPHLHFEIWLPSGQRTDPASWLREHGISP